MPPRRTPKDTPAKLAKRALAVDGAWFCSAPRGQILGTVEAPDVAAAKAAATVRFELEKVQRNRIMVQELG